MYKVKESDLFLSGYSNSDKSSQSKDIEKAKEMAKEYHNE